jgi:hypothetical protein
MTEDPKLNPQPAPAKPPEKPEKPATTPNTSLWARLSEFIADQDDKGRQEVKWSIALVFGIFVGIILIGLYAMYSPPSRGHVLAVSLLSAGAALAMGLLVGFLFGIPRAVQDGNAPPATGPTFKANTNLEQISDWLTKIIVGVGLVQLATIPGKLRNLGDYFATAFGVPAVPASVVLTLFGYFGIFGFLLGYLWARIYLVRVFSE